MLCAALLAVTAIASVRADYQDCRSCHYAVLPESTAPDFTNYFNTPGHHPVHVAYPAKAEYNATDAVVADILFFDRDGDGLPGPDEVQIFRSIDGDMIECSSCHVEHGIGPPATNHPVEYVRSATANNVLCGFCHNL